LLLRGEAAAAGGGREEEGGKESEGREDRSVAVGVGGVGESKGN
jgi:hypothetical protein